MTWSSKDYRDYLGHGSSASKEVTPIWVTLTYALIGIGLLTAGAVGLARHRDNSSFFVILGLA